jgi:hypothetical protein
MTIMVNYLKYSESPRLNLRALSPGPGGSAVKDKYDQDAIAALLAAAWSPRRTRHVSPNQLDLPLAEPAQNRPGSPLARFHRRGYLAELVPVSHARQEDGFR